MPNISQNGSQGLTKIGDSREAFGDLRFRLSFFSSASGFMSAQLHPCGIELLTSDALVSLSFATGIRYAKKGPICKSRYSIYTQDFTT